MKFALHVALMLVVPVIAGGLATYVLYCHERGIDVWRWAVNVSLFHWYRHFHPLLMSIDDARKGRVRHPVRRPIRSTRNDAKRAARKYASEYAGRELSWKAARKLLARLERKLATEGNA